MILFSLKFIYLAIVLFKKVLVSFISFKKNVSFPFKLKSLVKRSVRVKVDVLIFFLNLLSILKIPSFFKILNLSDLLINP